MRIAIVSCAAFILALTPLPQAVAQSLPQDDQTPTSSQRSAGQSTAPQGHNSQPQGHPGPLNTTTGGAPAESPQGQTPPGMQAAPDGATKPVRESGK